MKTYRKRMKTYRKPMKTYRKPMKARCLPSLTKANRQMVGRFAPHHLSMIFVRLAGLVWAAWASQQSRTLLGNFKSQSRGQLRAFLVPPL